MTKTSSSVINAQFHYQYSDFLSRCHQSHRESRGDSYGHGPLHNGGQASREHCRDLWEGTGRSGEGNRWVYFNTQYHSEICIDIVTIMSKKLAFAFRTASLDFTRGSKPTLFINIVQKLTKSTKTWHGISVT